MFRVATTWRVYDAPTDKGNPLFDVVVDRDGLAHFATRDEHEDTDASGLRMAAQQLNALADEIEKDHTRHEC